MQRMTKTKIEIPSDASDELIGKIFNTPGVELVKEYNPETMKEVVNGKKIGWCETEASEDVAIAESAKGNLEIVEKFPKRYIEKDKKLLEITAENHKDENLENMTSSIPEKFLPKEIVDKEIEEIAKEL